MSNPKQFTNEEAKAALKEQIIQNLNNLTGLTRNTIKTSRTTELFQNSLKNFSSTDTNIENTGDKLNKINIITAQLKFQAEAIESDCKLFKEISSQINSILLK